MELLFIIILFCYLWFNVLRMFSKDNEKKYLFFDI